MKSIQYIWQQQSWPWHDVWIKDAFAEGMDWDAYAKYIEDEKPDILGIGGMTPVIDTSFKAIKIARRKGEAVTPLPLI